MVEEKKKGGDVPDDIEDERNLRCWSSRCTAVFGLNLVIEFRRNFGDYF